MSPFHLSPVVWLHLSAVLALLSVSLHSFHIFLQVSTSAGAVARARPIMASKVDVVPVFPEPIVQ